MVSGSDICIGKQIIVSFFEHGIQFSRMPIAHTCGCTLELPTYADYTEMKTEFSAVLRANVWVRDIV